MGKIIKEKHMTGQKKYKKTPTIFQTEAAECGAASLAMVFLYYGKNLSIERIRAETGTSRNGCSAGDIMRTARKYGLICRGYRKKASELKTVATPCILYWNNNHFVVFEGFKKKCPYINDPASGRRSVSVEEMTDCFSGIVLTFEPTENFIIEESPSLFFRIFKFIRKNKRAISMGVLSYTGLLFIGALSLLPDLLTPILFRVFLDEVFLAGKRDIFLCLIIVMLLSALIRSAFTFFWRRMTIKLQKKAALLFGKEFLSNMLRLPISFFDLRYVGDLADRTVNGVGVSDFFISGTAEIFLMFLSSVLCLILMLIYSPVLTVVVIISGMINSVFIKIISDKLSDGMMRYRQDFGKLAGTVCEGIEIAETVKAAGAEDSYEKKIWKSSEKFFEEKQRVLRLQHIYGTVLQAVKTLACVWIIMIGGTMAANGEITVGTAAAFIALFFSFTEPLERLPEFLKKFHEVKANLSRTADTVNHKVDSKFDDLAKKAEIKTKISGNVELKNISFGYSSLRVPDIENFSIKIGCGFSTAIVGASGCGKSTVAKIISGLYEPWSGELLFDGISAKKLPRSVLSACVSYISQDTTLFSGSIRDNITMWSSEISEQDMIAAAKDACIHDIILNKPQGYDFMLTNGGANMSGGQRQRLEIAQALATNPAVLVMDEATGSLDALTEKQIMDHIKRRGCTCIVIAHRLSTVRDCDRIIVMSEGKITDIGTHSELIKSSFRYRDLIQD